MLLKTHLMFAALLALLFINHINDKFVFVAMVFISTILPDLDTGYSSLGRHFIFRPLQVFVKHRGVIHSFSFAILVSIILTFFVPVISLGFFAGYSVHLLCDSFTREGIQPFWPFSPRSSGFILTGGRIEETLFFSLIFVNLILALIIFVF